MICSRGEVYEKFKVDIKLHSGSNYKLVHNELMRERTDRDIIMCKIMSCTRTIREIVNPERSSPQYPTLVSRRTNF